MVHDLKHGDRASIRDGIVSLGEEVLLHEIVNPLIGLTPVLVSRVNHVLSETLS